MPAPAITPKRERRAVYVLVAAAVLAGAAVFVTVLAGIGLSSSGAVTSTQTTSPVAPGPTVDVKQSTISQNWAGYVAHGRNFSSVSGSWVVPSVSKSGYSAFWVGLGGASSTSRALEQIGTESDRVNGRDTYLAWYELVPAPSRPLALSVHPRDLVSARVAVSGTTVTVSLSNATTGKAVTKTLRIPNPDTSTAEWIAEAPSTPASNGHYRILRLADYGTATFSNASATANEHTGSITDPDWTAEQVDLASVSQLFRGQPGYAGPVPPRNVLSNSKDGASADELTSGLTGDGSSFSVSWQSTVAAIRSLEQHGWLGG